MEETDFHRFEVTFARLEETFQVKHISTYNLKTQPYGNEDGYKTVLAENPDFDQVPLVDSEGQIIAVLERDETTYSIQYLKSSMLLTDTYPLKKFLDLMLNNPVQRYYLVLCGNEIVGLVERSDLLRLPVRLHAFTLIAHLEQLMTDIINSKYLAEDYTEWLQILDLEGSLWDRDRNNAQNRKVKLLNLAKKHLKDNLFVSYLELTNFDDKAIIVNHLLKKHQNFEEKIKGVYQLRNSIDHVKNYAVDNPSLNQFLKGLNLTEELIELLKSHFNAYEKES